MKRLARVRTVSRAVLEAAQEYLQYYVDIEVGIGKAKCSLSKLIRAARGGRRVYLLSRGKRVAELIPVRENSNNRGRGMFKDVINIPPSWGAQEQREQWEKEFLEELGCR